MGVYGNNGGDWGLGIGDPGSGWAWELFDVDIQMNTLGVGYCKYGGCVPEQLLIHKPRL